MRLRDAFKAFFILLGHSDKADRIAAVLNGDASPSVGQPAHGEHKEGPRIAPRPELIPVTAPVPEQSEAITLLTALQREARFIDFIKESLQDYSVQEIGAACLAVHDDAAAVLERFFAIRPLSDGEEGQSVTVAQNNPAQCTLSGNVSGEFPVTGQLVHGGWIATKCDLPKWSGAKIDAAVIAPFELEVK